MLLKRIDKFLSQVQRVIIANLLPRAQVEADDGISRHLSRIGNQDEVLVPEICCLPRENAGG